MKTRLNYKLFNTKERAKITLERLRTRLYIEIKYFSIEKSKGLLRVL